MKKTILSITLLLIAFFGYSQGKIKKIEINEEGYNLKISFEPIVNQIDYNGLSVKIAPVSSNNLNKMFFIENKNNGIFEYSHYDKKIESYFLKKKKNKREKSDYEFLYEGALWLFNNNQINQNVFNELINQIN